MNTEIKNMIEAQKEILSTLPQNNNKNKKKYFEKVNELYEQYNNLFIEVTEEIKKRNSNYISKIKNSSSYEDVLNNINEMKSTFYLFNKYNTSYEKMEFDRLLYSLSLNDKDLTSVNSIIYDLISKFKEVGVVLTVDSFKYSPIVYEYMKFYFKYIENLGDSALKEVFEKLYWKFPNIIVHIELCFKNLYFKYKKYFDKYVEVQKEKVLKKYSTDILNIYGKSKIDYDLGVNNNIYDVFNQFVTKSLNPGDFFEDKIKQVVSGYVDLDYFNNNYDLVINNFHKLYNTINEYKSYLNYSFMIDDMKKLYADREKFKNGFKNKYKDIVREEKKLSKICRKVYFYSKRSNKEELIDKLDMDIDLLIVNLKNLYDSLEDDKFNENLLKLSDNSEIISLFEIASSYYIYHVKCLSNSPEEINIVDSTNNLNELLISPYNNLINNINIGDNKEINVIISELYKLSNININSDSLLDVANLDNILANLDKIFKYDLLMKNNINLDELLFVYNVSDLF